MSRRFEPHLEILPPPQKGLWERLCPAGEQGFVLYGGTAIALRLAHRVSVDFDFFSEAPLDTDRLRESMPFVADGTVLQQKPGSLTLLVAHGDEAEGVKVSFFGGIGFGRVGEPELTGDGCLWVASPEDLMATKLKTILQRVEAKDYRDIAALLKAGSSLSQGLSDARSMFGPAFQPSESLKALVYFEGGDLHSLEAGEKERLVEAVRAVGDLPGSVRQSWRLGME